MHAIVSKVADWWRVEDARELFEVHSKQRHLKMSDVILRSALVDSSLRRHALKTHWNVLVNTVKLPNYIWGGSLYYFKMQFSAENVLGFLSAE